MAFGITPITGYAFIMDGDLLPVPPSSVSVSQKGQNSTIELLDGRQVNILKNPALEEISFDFLLPHTKYPFVRVAELKSVKYYLNKLSQLAAGRRAFLFMISRNTPDGKSIFPTVMNVTLESWSYKEDASYGNDIVASVKLKRYEYFETKKLYIEDVTSAVSAAGTLISTVLSADGTAAATVEGTAQREDNRELAQYYTVKKGDTLWGICKQYFDDGSRYNEIAKLNGISNPNRISVGQTIKMFETAE